MKKFKKFTAVAGAAAIMGAGALTAPTAFAQEEGSASTVTESSQGENGEGDVSSDVETSSNELSSDLGSSEGEGEGAEGDASSEFQTSSDELSSNLPGSSEESTEGGEGEGSSQEEQTLLGVGIFAAIAGGIASFLPQLQNMMP